MRLPNNHAFSSSSRKFKTDYNIPKFGFKSAFFVFFTIFLSLWILPLVSNFLKVDYRWATIILGSILGGFSVSIAQYMIESKKGMTRNFWIIGGVWTLIVAIIYYFVIMKGLIF